MKVSICLSAYDKPVHLDRTLTSIFRQSPPFDIEVIVVIDGGSTDEVYLTALHYPAIVHRICRRDGYRNPAVARNLAYRAARGEVIIAQSDDVEHQGDAIETLVGSLRPGSFVLANVLNYYLSGEPATCYGDWHELVGPRGRARRPLFFLGALWREDLYAVGGCDEDFTAPGREDVWFGDCLIRGRGLAPVYLEDAVGHHLHHERLADLPNRTAPSKRLYRQKHARAQRTGVWCAAGGPWELRSPVPS